MSTTPRADYVLNAHHYVIEYFSVPTGTFCFRATHLPTGAVVHINADAGFGTIHKTKLLKLLEQVVKDSK